MLLVARCFMWSGSSWSAVSNRFRWQQVAQAVLILHGGEL